MWPRVEFAQTSFFGEQCLANSPQICQTMHKFGKFSIVFSFKSGESIFSEIEWQFLLQKAVKQLFACFFSILGCKSKTVTDVGLVGLAYTLSFFGIHRWGAKLSTIILSDYSSIFPLSNLQIIFYSNRFKRSSSTLILL